MEIVWKFNSPKGLGGGAVMKGLVGFVTIYLWLLVHCR